VEPPGQPKGTRFVGWPSAPIDSEQPTPATGPSDQAIFLRGTLGRVTPFDVVQVAENNLITGRLCVDRQGQVGTIYFDKGRIVAAAFGSDRAHEALKILLMAEAGPFTLEIATHDEIPPDEFRSKNNTTLLVSVLRIVDSEKEVGSERANTRSAHTTGDLVEKNSSRDSGRLGDYDSDFDQWDPDDKSRRN